MNTIREAFMETLNDTLDAENQIIKALPKVIKNVESDELRDAVESHLEETEEHARRLEQVFEMFDESPRRKKCKGMQGLIAEGQETMEEEKGEAATILALQKVEHYEIAAYGALVAWAKLLEEQEAVGVLEKTLAEEKETDQKLNDIAQEIVNIEEQEDEDRSERRKAA